MDLITILQHVQKLTPQEARRLEAMLAICRLNEEDLGELRYSMLGLREGAPQQDLMECSRVLAERAEDFCTDLKVEPGSVSDISAVAGTLGAWMEGIEDEGTDVDLD